MQEKNVHNQDPQFARQLKHKTVTPMLFDSFTLQNVTERPYYTHASCPQVRGPQQQPSKRAHWADTVTEIPRSGTTPRERAARRSSWALELFPPQERGSSRASAAAAKFDATYVAQVGTERPLS
ncbi:hypothetical protein LMH87_001912 [Akanthomyces muscarius]|uniref:Uncharacterized protein n=1 Tax=Akanthomyces muscarius TaxID=2231603 RepID=A0A9W8Q596_AKAMU|nr:hypothetical protein LMH87_001912 [Akanthomyces muscarius]KAJ4147390.1 hypothetical protein LMH87_001912 [Akanthomyces muscarius]